MSHTPGPWNIHPAYADDLPMPVRSDDGSQRWNWLALRIAKGERLIGYAEFNDCDQCGFPHVADVAEARANARLMVAAPELLDALMEFSGVWDSGHTFAEMDVDDVEAMRARARAAIAKATGGA
jgi:hypothetical protein